MSKGNEHTAISFKILPATPNDIPELVKVYIESFSSDDSFFKLDNENIPADVLLAREIRQHIGKFQDQWGEFFKAVDTSNGAIAGFCSFIFPLEGQPARSVEEQRLRSEDQSLAGCKEIVARVPPKELCPRESSPLSCKAWDLRREATRRWCDWREHFTIDCLAVRPCYRRHRLGARLLQAGLDIADEREAKIYVTASSMGLPVYLKQGFEVVEQVEIDFGKYGLDKETCMIREPEWVTIWDDSEE